jgi:hypothetical protein
VIVKLNVDDEGQTPFVLKVTVYVCGAVLALKSISPVDVFKKVTPAGEAVKVPVAPPVMVAKGSVPVTQ